MAAQVFLLLALAPVEMRLWGWDPERWFLVPWVRGRGEIVLAAWLASWGWGTWWWHLVVPGVWRAVVFGLPLFGLPLAGSWGWLDRSRWPAVTPASDRAVPDSSFVPAFIGGVVVTALVLACVVDPRAGGTGRTALVWLAAGVLHAAGWSTRRSVLWLFPFPVPAIAVLRWALGSRERSESLTWYAFSNTNASRRWASWELLGRDLHARWDRLPWRLRWRGSGKARRRILTRADRRRHLKSRLSAALFLSHGVLLGLVTDGVWEGELQLTTPFPAWLRLTLWTSLVLMFLGAVPSLLRVVARSLALSRDGWTNLAARGTRLTVGVYLLTSGGLVGLLLFTGELRGAGALLALTMCLLTILGVLVLLVRMVLDALPFMSDRPRSNRDFAWLAVPLLAALVGVPLATSRDWMADGAAWILVSSAILAPAGSYLLRRLP